MTISQKFWNVFGFGAWVAMKDWPRDLNLMKEAFMYEVGGDPGVIIIISWNDFFHYLILSSMLCGFYHKELMNIQSCFLQKLVW